MVRVHFIEHAGRRVLRVDFSGISEPEELKRIAGEAAVSVRAEPSGSTLVLVLLSGVPYGLRVVRLLGELAAVNEPYVRARAIVGLPAIAAPAVAEFSQHSRRPVRAFDELADALDWLVAHAAPPPGAGG